MPSVATIWKITGVVSTTACVAAVVWALVVTQDAERLEDQLAEQRSKTERAEEHFSRACSGRLDNIRLALTVLDDLPTSAPVKNLRRTQLMEPWFASCHKEYSELLEWLGAPAGDVAAQKLWIDDFVNLGAGRMRAAAKEHDQR